MPTHSNIDSAELINTRSTPSIAYGSALEALECSHYYNLSPYPRFAFGQQQWPLEKGPWPTPLPYVKILTNEIAEFTFQGGTPAFETPDDDRASELLAAVIEANNLPSRYVGLAVRAGITGTLAAKFSYLPDDLESPVRLSFLSVPEECRVWLDPHDQQSVLMARIQYPYRDPVDNHWYWFREEWTAETWVRYAPTFAGDRGILSGVLLPGYYDAFGDTATFVIESQDPNPFGVVPVRLIKNLHVEGVPAGVGDTWNAFRLIDRIALTLHGEDRSNQLHSEPSTVVINSRVNNQDPLQPGEVMTIEGKDKDFPADVKLLETTGAAREFAFRSIDKWEELLYRQVGVSRVDPATIGNKGNMTRLALMTAYARSVSTANRKRTLWGRAGLCRFFSDMLYGLSNLGDFTELRGVSRGIDVTCDWPDYFAMTDADIGDLSQRTISQHDAGMIDHERAIKRIGNAEGVEDSEMNNLVADTKAEVEMRRLRAEASVSSSRGKRTGTASNEQDVTGQEYTDVIDASGANNFTA